MCLLLCSREGKLMPENKIENAYHHNPHGFGIAFANNGKLEVYKTMYYADIRPLFNQINGRPYVAHFRAGTHGTIGLEMCHPFEMSKDVVVFHNGVIDIKGIPEGKSDTWTFTEKILKKYFLPDYKEKLDLLEQLVGGWNKLAFIDNTGDITVANESGGHWSKGVWYSNAYSLYSRGYIQQMLACAGGVADEIFALEIPE